MQEQPDNAMLGRQQGVGRGGRTMTEPIEPIEELYDRLHWYAVESLKQLPSCCIEILMLVADRNHHHKILPTIKKLFPAWLDDVTDCRDGLVDYDDIKIMSDCLNYVWREPNAKLAEAINHENYEAVFFWGFTDIEDYGLLLAKMERKRKK
jgi:SUMO ligase MMS21 Smc5/6 complex component